MKHIFQIDHKYHEIKSLIDFTWQIGAMINYLAIAILIITNFIYRDFAYFFLTLAIVIGLIFSLLILKLGLELASIAYSVFLLLHQQIDLLETIEKKLSNKVKMTSNEDCTYQEKQSSNIVFVCPQCGLTKGMLPKTYLGRHIKCPHCGARAMPYPSDTVNQEH